MSWPTNDLRAHYVSRPAVEYFSRLFNGYSYLQAHCVSRRAPVDSTHRIRLKPRGLLRLRSSHQASAQTVLPVIVRVTTSPTLARKAVTLLLAARVAADMLAIT